MPTTSTGRTGGLNMRMLQSRESTSYNPRRTPFSNTAEIGEKNEYSIREPLSHLGGTNTEL